MVSTCLNWKDGKLVEERDTTAEALEELNVLLKISFGDKLDDDDQEVLARYMAENEAMERVQQKRLFKRVGARWTP